MGRVAGNTSCAIVLAGAIAIGAGCQPQTQAATADYVATRKYQRSKRTAAQVEVFFEGQPPERPVEVVAIVKGFVREWDQTPQMVEKVKALAAAKGLDGVQDFVCAPPGTVGYGVCQGKGFIYVAE